MSRTHEERTGIYTHLATAYRRVPLSCMKIALKKLALLVSLYHAACCCAYIMGSTSTFYYWHFVQVDPATSILINSRNCSAMHDSDWFFELGNRQAGRTLRYSTRIQIWTSSRMSVCKKFFIRVPCPGFAPSSIYMLNQTLGHRISLSPAKISLTGFHLSNSRQLFLHAQWLLPYLSSTRLSLSSLLKEQIK